MAGSRWMPCQTRSRSAASSSTSRTPRSSPAALGRDPTFEVAPSEPGVGLVGDGSAHVRADVADLALLPPDVDLGEGLGHHVLGLVRIADEQVGQAHRLPVVGVVDAANDGSSATASRTIASTCVPISSWTHRSGDLPAERPLHTTSTHGTRPRLHRDRGLRRVRQRAWPRRPRRRPRASAPRPPARPRRSRPCGRSPPTRAARTRDDQLGPGSSTVAAGSGAPPMTTVSSPRTPSVPTRAARSPRPPADHLLVELGQLATQRCGPVGPERVGEVAEVVVGAVRRDVEDERSDARSRARRAVRGGARPCGAGTPRTPPGRREPGHDQRREQRRGAGDRLDAEARRGDGGDEPVTGVGERRASPRRRPARAARRPAMRARTSADPVAFVVLVQAELAHLAADVRQQLAGPAGVLGEDQVGGRGAPRQRAVTGHRGCRSAWRPRPARRHARPASSLTLPPPSVHRGPRPRRAYARRVTRRRPPPAFVAAVAVAAVAAAVTFVRLGEPPGIVFDETYYVTDARAMLDDRRRTRLRGPPAARQVGHRGRHRGGRRRPCRVAGRRRAAWRSSPSRRASSWPAV